MADWETSKENFAPLRQGRDVTKQQVTAVMLLDASRATEIDETRKKLWKDIETYDGPDPLLPWLRLVKWTNETFATGGKKAELRKILEECISRRVIKQDRYKNDLRCINLWIAYANCLPDPIDVFKYMMAHHIGEKVAMFWQAFAAYNEGKGSFELAAGILNKGIERGAEPMQKLKQYQASFKARWCKEVLRKQQEMELGVASAAPIRSALKDNAGVFVPIHQHIQPVQQSTKLELEEDCNLAQENLHNGIPVNGTGHAPEPDSPPNDLPLPTFSEGHKENIDVATAWTSYKVATKPEFVVPAASKIEMHVDEQFESSPSPEPLPEFGPARTSRPLDCTSPAKPSGPQHLLGRDSSTVTGRSGLLQSALGAAALRPGTSSMARPSILNPTSSLLGARASGSVVLGARPNLLNPTASAAGGFLPAAAQPTATSAASGVLGRATGSLAGLSSRDQQAGGSRIAGLLGSSRRAANTVPTTLPHQPAPLHSVLHSLGSQTGNTSARLDNLGGLAASGTAKQVDVRSQLSGGVLAQGQSASAASSLPEKMASLDLLGKDVEIVTQEVEAAGAKAPNNDHEEDGCVEQQQSAAQSSSITTSHAQTPTVGPIPNLGPAAPFKGTVGRGSRLGKAGHFVPPKAGYEGLIQRIQNAGSGKGPVPPVARLVDSAESSPSQDPLRGAAACNTFIRQEEGQPAQQNNTFNDRTGMQAASQQLTTAPTVNASRTTERRQQVTSSDGMRAGLGTGPSMLDRRLGGLSSTLLPLQSQASLHHTTLLQPPAAQVQSAGSMEVAGRAPCKQQQQQQHSSTVPHSCQPEQQNSGNECLQVTASSTLSSTSHPPLVPAPYSAAVFGTPPASLFATARFTMPPGMPASPPSPSAEISKQFAHPGDVATDKIQLPGQTGAAAVPALPSSLTMAGNNSPCSPTLAALQKDAPLTPHDTQPAVACPQPGVLVREQTVVREQAVTVFTRNAHELMNEAMASDDDDEREEGWMEASPAAVTLFTKGAYADFDKMFNGEDDKTQMHTRGQSRAFRRRKSSVACFSIREDTHLGPTKPEPQVSGNLPSLGIYEDTSFRTRVPCNPLNAAQEEHLATPAKDPRAPAALILHEDTDFKTRVVDSPHPSTVGSPDPEHMPSPSHPQGAQLELRMDTEFCTAAPSNPCRIPSLPQSRLDQPRSRSVFDTENVPPRAQKENSTAFQTGIPQASFPPPINIRPRCSSVFDSENMGGPTDPFCSTATLDGNAPRPSTRYPSSGGLVGSTTAPRHTNDENAPSSRLYPASAAAEHTEPGVSQRGDVTSHSRQQAGAVPNMFDTSFSQNAGFQLKEGLSFAAGGLHGGVERSQLLDLHADTDLLENMADRGDDRGREGGTGDEFDVRLDSPDRVKRRKTAATACAPDENAPFSPDEDDGKENNPKLDAASRQLPARSLFTEGALNSLLQPVSPNRAFALNLHMEPTEHPSALSPAQRALFQDMPRRY